MWFAEPSDLNIYGMDDMGSGTDDNELKMPKQINQNKEKQFDTSCSICMVEFFELEPLTRTVCKHTFHEQCIMSWINKKVNTKKLLIKKKDEPRTYEILKNDGPICPNCNKPLI